MTVHPRDDQLAALAAVADTDPDVPVQMLNLLRFDGDAGRASYETYGRLMAEQLARRGATVRYRGRADQVLIGPEDEAWDELLLVEYPSKQVFLDMASDPEYQVVARHRTAALADSRLVVCRELQRDPAAQGTASPTR